MSARKRIPSRSTILDDPFFTKLDSLNPLSMHEKTPSGCAGGFGGDAYDETKMAAGSSIFGNAPLYLRLSSAVKLPSSPTSRRCPTTHNSLDRSSHPLRASTTLLNASAAPFQPKAVSPFRQDGNKRSVSYPSSVQEILGGEDCTMPDEKESHEQGHTRKKNFDWKASSPMMRSNNCSKQPDLSEELAEIALSYFRPRRPLPSYDARFTTPSDTDQLSFSAQDKRKLAYSDEPSFYQPSIMPRHASSPSSVGKTRTDKEALQYNQRLKSLPGGYTLQTQHPLTSHSSSSMPRLSDQKFEPVQFNETNRIHHNHKTENRMLNHLDQGPFQGDQNGDTPQSTVFDHYTPTPSIASQNHTTPQPQINPYSDDANTMGSGAYFPGSTNYPQQVIWPQN